jgi:2-hydroxy-3-keto-5-methylthiopentenyl-1-phosphate phosphatase
MSVSESNSLRSQSCRSALVCDFDGTLTQHDFYKLVQARWWKPEEANPWDEYLAGRLSHFDALNRIFARVRGEEVEVRGFVKTMELDPTLSGAFHQLHAAGWALIIASAGCEWYIRQLLTEVDVPVTLHANPGRFSPDSGLVMSPPAKSAFYTPSTGIDKVAVMRDALSRYDRVAFAGDGPPDLPAARLVPGERRFARGWLAEALKAEGLSFEPLVDLASAAMHLLKA